MPNAICQLRVEILSRGFVMELSIPHLDASVVVELRAFLVALSHMPVDLQVAVLQDGTEQIVGAIERQSTSH